jgi:folate-binding Fe-S cluster repair protein YgfZ
MWSNLRVFRRDGGFAWIERRSLRDAQLTELKKYAVFSKVTIAANDDLVLLGWPASRRAPRWRRCSPPARRRPGGQRRRHQPAVV